MLASLLRQWRQTQLQFPDTVAAPPQMVAEVASVAPRLWSLALEEARTHVQSDLDLLTVALRDANAATDEVQGLLDESVQMRDQLHEERTRASAAAEAMHARCVAVDAQLFHQVTIVTETQAALKRQQETAEQLYSKLSLSVTTRDHECAKLRAEIATREQKISDQRASLMEKDSALSVASAANAQLSDDAQRLTVLSSTCQQQISDLERQLVVARVMHQEQLISRNREILDLRAQKDFLLSQIGEMQIAKEALEKNCAKDDQVHTHFTTHQAVLEQVIKRLTEIERHVIPIPPSKIES